MAKGLKTAVGLMSGTSLDGVDAALLRTDGIRIDRTGHSLELPYDPETRTLLRAALGGGGDVLAAERAMTLRHAEAVERLLGQAGLVPEAVDVIGFHGQTLIHRPEEGLTWQIGDGALLAELTAIDVVNDFRRRDMAAGGQGAPLVPLYHAALAATIDAKPPVAVLNIGGVANLTWMDGARIVAFDTGPGGALLDDWVLRKTGAAFDRDGTLALSGAADMARVDAALAHDYFSRPGPKSLDRDAFVIDLEGLSDADGAATLVAFTTAAVARAVDHLPQPPTRWVVTGGGRRNVALRTALAHRLNVEIALAEEAGWNGDSMEAEAFAFLAVRSLAGLPLSLPETTGVRAPMTGGALYRAATGLRP